jgi:hypothetical protein
MNRQMIRQLADNHMRQYTGARRALLNRLRRLRRRSHRAGTGLLLAGVLNHQHLRRDVLISFADFFSNMT